MSEYELEKEIVPLKVQEDEDELTAEERETIQRMKHANPVFYAILFQGKVDRTHNINQGRRCIVGEFHGLDK